MRGPRIDGFFPISEIIWFSGIVFVKDGDEGIL